MAVVNQRIVAAGVLAGAGLLVVLFVTVVLLPRLLDPPLSAAALSRVTGAQARIQLQQAQSQLENDARASVLQGLAGLVVVIGGIATWRQVHISREGQITDRFTRAVDQLGSPVTDIRIGALYGLERIARISPADRDHIQYMLCAFIRTHAAWPTRGTDWAPGRGGRMWRILRAGRTGCGSPQHPAAAVDHQVPWMRVRAADIQAAMGVLGRLPPSREEPVIYLSRVDLRSIALRRARLIGARFRHANLARAVLDAVHLEHSDLTAADLREAVLENAHLNGAVLAGAYLHGARLSGADLTDADLRGADLAGAILDGTILTGAQADQHTTWPTGFNLARRRRRGIVEAGLDSAPALAANTVAGRPARTNSTTSM
jgi:Pentapeptide repeats (8 copies)